MFSVCLLRYSYSNPYRSKTPELFDSKKKTPHYTVLKIFFCGHVLVNIINMKLSSEKPSDTYLRRKNEKNVLKKISNIIRCTALKKTRKKNSLLTV